jgi:Tfp pilus assembly protein PilV
MPPRASRSFPPQRLEQGVLLVEAVLSAVVIAVGLTFITRALGGQLNALQRVEEYASLMEAAQQAMRTMEVDVQAGKPPRRLQDGSFTWTLSATKLEDPDLLLDVSRVTLSVRRTDLSGPSYSVQAVWPTPLIPADWFSS